MPCGAFPVFHNRSAADQSFSAIKAAAYQRIEQAEETIENERAVVRARAPSCQLVTVLNEPAPAPGSAATAALVPS